MAARARKRCLNVERVDAIVEMEGDGDEKRPRRGRVSSLLELSARMVAVTQSYESVEERVGLVPEPVQKRLAYWAFPRDENAILLYTSTKSALPAELAKQPFQVGRRLLMKDAVSDVMQVGFHLSGMVRDTVATHRKCTSHRVSVTFDRQVITSAQCACSNQNVLWCAHVVALVLYRMRNHVTIKCPISDAVYQMGKPELQKLVLNLLAEHHNSILPAVQRLVDELRKPGSELARMRGSPDPTVGACAEASTCWFIDTDAIREDISRAFAPGSTGVSVAVLFNKVLELFSAGDANYLHLLEAITEGVIREMEAAPSAAQQVGARKQCDTLATVWLSVLVQQPGRDVPLIDSQRRLVMLERLTEEWGRSAHCPRENVDDVHSSRGMLQFIGDAFKQTADEIQDDIIVQAALVDSLCLRGLKDEATEAALRIVSSTKSTLLARSCIHSSELSHGGLLSHVTDPYFTLCNALIDAGHELPALDVALTALTQCYSIPHGHFAQARLFHRAEKMLLLLEGLDIASKPVLLNCVREFADFMLRSWTASAEQRVAMLPLHCFVRFLFKHLLLMDVEFAFRLGCFLLPLNVSGGAGQERRPLSVAGVVCASAKDVECQQAELAAVMLQNCNECEKHVARVLDRVLESVSQPTHLLRLAHLCEDAVAASSKAPAPWRRRLLEAAFELGVRTICLVNNESERLNCIRWLITRALEAGMHAVDFLVANWSELFYAKEVASDVARLLLSGTENARLRLADPVDSERLTASVRDMLVQATMREPAACVMHSLAVSKEHPKTFDLIVNVVMATANRMNTAQLFGVARFLRGRSLLAQAFKVGVLALKQMDIGLFDENHPATRDVLWLCALANELGTDELTQLVPAVTNCVRNPMVLTEIARRCSSESSCGGGGGGTIVAPHSCNKEPLNRLLAHAQKLFAEDIDYKLRNITPKSYSKFVGYLRDVQLAFALSDDGPEQFGSLVDYIVRSQKGKKKLKSLVQHVIASGV